MRDKTTGYSPRPVPGVTPEERIMVTTRTPMCDGGSEALGHPAVALRIEGESVTCPYCSRSFVLAEGAGHDDHH